MCPACMRRVYKVVSLEKFVTLPRDYGPAPRLVKSFAKRFKESAHRLLIGSGACSSQPQALTGGETCAHTVEFGEGSIGLELIPHKDGGGVVKSVSGPAKEAGLQLNEKLLKVNAMDVSSLEFSELMLKLQKAQRPIQMVFDGMS